MNKINCIIIEDEFHNCELLKLMIEDHCPQLNMLGNCTSIVEAKRTIEKLNPDLLFLDIELKDGNAFELLELYDHYRFLTIFITGYDQFSLKAIKHSAIDYILKPVTEDDLKNAVQKAIEFYEAREIMKRKSLSKNDLKPAEEDDSLLIKMVSGNKVVKYMSIYYISADDPYCRIYFKDNTFAFFESSLKYLESILPNYFYRIHKSYLVNIKQVDSWEKGVGGSLTLINGKNLPISYRAKSGFNKIMADTYIVK